MALTDLFRKKKSPRVMVVGIDGLPHSLSKKFIADGTFAFLGKLAKSGRLAKMKVSLPEISAVSWPTFMTGRNPGEHGIFGFTDLKPGSYQMVFPSFADLKTTTLWDRLGQAGKSSVVINQPGTYPARKIKGALVSGFVAVDLMKAVQPIKYLGPLRRLNYEVDVDTQRCRKDHNWLFVDLDRTLEARDKAVELLAKEEDWDFFQVVVTGTDRLQHYLWEAVENTGHPLHAKAVEYYRKVDRFVQTQWERFHKAADVSREGEGFFILSDHGFCGIRREVYLNAWLKEQGWLAWEKPEPDSLENLSAETKAFVMDPSRIYIHRKGRFPKGRVEETEAEGLKREIKATLLELQHEGQPVIRQVFERDEIYRGPETPRGPDLVALSHWGFDLKGSVKAAQVFGRTDLTGMHTWDDALFWSADPVKEDLNIVDLAAILEAKLLA